jgi:hypothetical protein
MATIIDKRFIFNPKKRAKAIAPNATWAAPFPINSIFFRTMKFDNNALPKPERMAPIKAYLIKG